MGSSHVTRFRAHSQWQMIQLGEATVQYCKYNTLLTFTHTHTHSLSLLSFSCLFSLFSRLFLSLSLLSFPLFSLIIHTHKVSLARAHSLSQSSDPKSAQHKSHAKRVCAGDLYSSPHTHDSGHRLHKQRGERRHSLLIALIFS
jgi:hypothetical protein